MCNHFDVLSSALNSLRLGGLCIYPTETFYALGCDACNHRAVAKLLAMKERSHTQGVPVLIGDLAQLPLAVDIIAMEAMVPAQRGAVAQLQERFWPGPLSLLLPAGAGLAAGVAGDNGLVALRISPHPVARHLCLKLDSPLVATSANQHGASPAMHEQELDAKLVHSVGCLAPLPPDTPGPAGGLPSTLALVGTAEDGTACVTIVRTGAVSAAAIAGLGLTVKSSDG